MPVKIIFNGIFPKGSLYLVQGIRGTTTARYLDQPSAHDYKAFKKAAAKVGITFMIPRWGDARNLKLQGELHNDPADFGSWLKSSQVAKAGASSHGFATNADVLAKPNLLGRRKKLTSADCYRWRNNNMGKFGWVQRDAAGDSNCLHHND